MANTGLAKLLEIASGLTNSFLFIPFMHAQSIGINSIFLQILKILNFHYFLLLIIENSLFK
jgi:hypothetical protein